MNSLSVAEIEAILENLLLEAQTQLKQQQHRQATRLATLTRSATALSASLDERIKHLTLAEFINSHHSDQSIALRAVLQKELVNKHDTQNKRKRTAPTPMLGTHDEPGLKKARNNDEQESAPTTKKKSTRTTKAKTTRATRTNPPTDSTAAPINPLFSPSTKEFTYEPPAELPHNEDPSPAKPVKKSRKGKNTREKEEEADAVDGDGGAEGDTSTENAFAAAIEKLKKSVSGMSEKERKKMEAKYGFALA